MKLCLQISTVLLSVLTAWGEKDSAELLNLAGFSSTQSRNLELKGFGTAFAVSPDGYLISASHVTEGSDALRVIFKNGQSLDATVIREEPKLDLALLKVDVPTPTFLTVTSRTAGLGDDIYTVGYPSPEWLGVNQKFTKGSISALSGLRDDSFRYQISVPIQPGNSGGPVVCEETGEVIGIVISTLRGKEVVGFNPQSVNYALKSAFIKPIMDSLEVKQYSSYRNRSLNKNDRRKVAVDSTCMVVTCKFSDYPQIRESVNEVVKQNPPKKVSKVPEILIETGTVRISITKGAYELNNLGPWADHFNVYVDGKLVRKVIGDRGGCYIPLSFKPDLGEKRKVTINAAFPRFGPIKSLGFVYHEIYSNNFSIKLANEENIQLQY